MRRKNGENSKNKPSIEKSTIISKKESTVQSDKKNSKIHSLVFIAGFFLAIVLIIAPLKLIIHKEEFYKSHFIKNGAYEKLGENKTNQILDNFLLFLDGNAELENFTVKETSHMLDVRVVLNRFFLVMNISLIMVLLILAYLVLKGESFLDDFFKVMFMGGLIAFAIVALMFLASLNFSMTFDGFHKIFFSQGNYIFSKDSLLITLFPQEFFLDFFQKILLTSLLYSLLVMIPQFFINRIHIKYKQ